MLASAISTQGEPIMSPEQLHVHDGCLQHPRLAQIVWEQSQRSPFVAPEAAQRRDNVNGHSDEGCMLSSIAAPMVSQNVPSDVACYDRVGSACFPAGASQASALATTLGVEGPSRYLQSPSHLHGFEGKGQLRQQQLLKQQPQEQLGKTATGGLQTPPTPWPEAPRSEAGLSEDAEAQRLLRQLSMYRSLSQAAGSLTADLFGPNLSGIPGLPLVDPFMSRLIAAISASSWDAKVSMECTEPAAAGGAADRSSGAAAGGVVAAEGHSAATAAADGSCLQGFAAAVGADRCSEELQQKQPQPQEVSKAAGCALRVPPTPGGRAASIDEHFCSEQGVPLELTDSVLRSCPTREGPMLSISNSILNRWVSSIGPPTSDADGVECVDPAAVMCHVDGKSQAAGGSSDTASEAAGGVVGPEGWLRGISATAAAGEGFCFPSLAAADAPVQNMQQVQPPASPMVLSLAAVTTRVAAGATAMTASSPQSPATPGAGFAAGVFGIGTLGADLGRSPAAAGAGGAGLTNGSCPGPAGVGLKPLRVVNLVGSPDPDSPAGTGTPAATAGGWGREGRTPSPQQHLSKPQEGYAHVGVAVNEGVRSPLSPFARSRLSPFALQPGGEAVQTEIGPGPRESAAVGAEALPGLDQQQQQVAAELVRKIRVNMNQQRLLQRLIQAQQVGAGAGAAAAGGNCNQHRTFHPRVNHLQHGAARGGVVHTALPVGMFTTAAAAVYSTPAMSPGYTGDQVLGRGGFRLAPLAGLAAGGAGVPYERQQQSPQASLARQQQQPGQEAQAGWKLETERREGVAERWHAVKYVSLLPAVAKDEVRQLQPPLAAMAAAGPPPEPATAASRGGRKKRGAEDVKHTYEEQVLPKPKRQKPGNSIAKAAAAAAAATIGGGRGQERGQLTPGSYAPSPSSGVSPGARDVLAGT